MLSKTFVFSPFQANTYILDAGNGECIIIDAAMYTEEEKRELSDYLDTHKLHTLWILNTHGHLDHLFGTAFLKDKYQCGIAGHADDDFLIRSSPEFASVYGLDSPTPPLPDRHLNDGSELEIGNIHIKCIHVPGHSPGSLAYLIESEKLILTGDALFAGSIGRTDLPGGNYDTLIESIQSKLLIQKSDYTLLPGHGPKTSLNEEKQSNQFLK